MRFRLFSTILLLSLHLAGCRTYGGHGSEAATVGQFVELTGWAARERNLVAGDLQALREAAGTREALGSAVSRLEALSAELDAAADRWAGVAATVDPSASYRVLHRELGGLIASRQAWENRYRILAADVSASLAGAAAGPREPSRYQVAPVHFERIRARIEDVRIRDLAATTR